MDIKPTDLLRDNGSLNTALVVTAPRVVQDFLHRPYDI